MPTTRNQGLPANAAPVKPNPPRPRKKKNGEGVNAAKVAESQTQSPSSVAESPLFKLPPELRTMIYRFALIDDEEVVVTEAGGVPEPALLSVCKNVRSETYKVFYYENDFCCEIQQLSPATLRLADRKATLPGLRFGVARPVMLFKQGHDQRNTVAIWCCGSASAYRENVNL